MSSMTKYQCFFCKSEKNVENSSEQSVICCGKPMVKQTLLEPCSVAVGPESSRFQDHDEPCDDGRSG